jgi:isocitrate dehydrogenase (NAD+)
MRKIGLLKGDGIGPEISDAMVRVVGALGLPIEWEEIPCGEQTLKSLGQAMPQAALDRIKDLGIAIKGPTATPVGTGHRSANVALRKELDLYANVRPCYKLSGVSTPFSQVDLIVVRENTEDLYMGVEKEVSPDEMHSIKIITRKGSERIHRYAFDIAQKQNRKKVTCVHKANIMKKTDGLFLAVFREVAKEYPQIEAAEMIVDNACMQLVTKPEQFDVIVTENLYGDILSDLCAGLVGGLGLAGGANIGKNGAVFEAVHGTAPDIAGKNKANPTAILFSAVMMLQHLKMNEEAEKLRKAIEEVYREGKALTGDLGGKASTTEFTNAIISKLKS